MCYRYPDMLLEVINQNTQMRKLQSITRCQVINHTNMLINYLVLVYPW